MQQFYDLVLFFPCNKDSFVNFFNKTSSESKFFAFYRSMQAYETALIGGETSLIMSPEDSEFFKFFGETLVQN